MDVFSRALILTATIATIHHAKGNEMRVTEGAPRSQRAARSQDPARLKSPRFCSSPPKQWHGICGFVISYKL